MATYEEIIEYFDEERLRISLLPYGSELQKEAKQKLFINAWKFRREILNKAISGELYKESKEKSGSTNKDSNQKEIKHEDEEKNQCEN
jgi:hypothetical protein